MPGSEMVDVVDERDRPIRKATLRTCLRQGLLHRAVAVVVERRGGEILLQRRSRRDLWHPGRWTLSYTGHVRTGESYFKAARRELREELNLASPVSRLGKLLLPPIRSKGLIEREHVTLFASQTDQEPIFDPVELDSVRTFTREALGKIMTGRRLTPDARLLLAEYLRKSRDHPGPGKTLKRI